jgi:UDP-N-acetylmuramoyl-tripeptide--D-alanyl-D-alanine ligase
MLASEFARLCQGGYAGGGDVSISGFATDSREVKPGDLFIAISGERVDGHEFVSQAFESGAVACLVEREVAGPHILVSKIEDGLAKFGQNIRRGFDGPVIGVTGSAGKTTTKEFVAAALGTLGPVVKSPGNKNTEYTSPLVWADLRSDTKCVVVEMAMRGFGQIANLAAVSSPTIGVVTNIGYSHLLQVGNRRGIAKAKGELIEALPDDGAAIAWREDDFYSELVEMAGSRQVHSFGFSDEADCRITGYMTTSLSSSEVEGICLGEHWRSSLPALGKHIALDAACAILTAKICGADLAVASAALEKVVLPPMRMETRELNGATVLLDTYNASPPSMLSAIESVCEVPASGRKFAILGEMRELGDATEEAHALVGRAVNSSCFDEVVFVGDSMAIALEQVSGSLPARLVGDVAMVKAFVSELRPGDVLLVKGSRALALEKIFD